MFTLSLFQKTNARPRLVTKLVHMKIYWPIIVKQILVSVFLIQVFGKTYRVLVRVCTFHSKTYFWCLSFSGKDEVSSSPEAFALGKKGKYGI